jgi:PAS domain S-box-containing protein
MRSGQSGVKGVMSNVEALKGLGELSGYEAILGIGQVVLDAIPAAVYVCAADGEVVRFNRRAAELWGQAPRPGDTEERFCGSFRLYQLDGSLLRHDRTPMEHVLRTGEPARDREVVIERPDGTRINVLVNIEPFTDAAGRVEGAINCFQDITERRLLEMSAQDSERRLRDILDALPSPIYTTDAEGRITFFNREAALLAGREPELGKDKWCVSWRLHSADGQPLPHDQCPMALALKEKRPIRGMEAVAERPDGTRVPFMPHPTPLFDEAGNLTGAVNMLVDVSAQREAAQKLIAGEARYRGFAEASHRLASIVESSADAIVSKDLNGVIVSWNNGAERLFGYTADEAVGRSITMLIPDDHLDEEPRILDRIRHGERIEHYETIRRRKDGTLINISLTVSPVKNADGRIIGASKIARDITDRRRHELSLSRRMEEQAALYQFTDRLYRAETLDDVYESALDAILRALRCSRASILLFDDAGMMRFVAWRGLSESYRKAVDGHSPWTSEEKSAQPIVMDDVDAADLDDSLRATITGEGIRALAFIPLVSQGKLIGKFMTYYEEPHSFESDEVDLAVTIARQLGFSVERMRAAEELRQNEERFRLATQTGKVGLWEWDIPSNSVSWTESLYGMHGITKEEFDSSVEGFDALVHPDDRERVSRALARALAEEGPYELEFRIRRPDGGIVWIFTNAVVLREGGQPVRLIGATVDITERKEAELQRDLLVAELSHRVKNTLATVISIARQSFSKAQSVEEASEVFNARIRALAQTHGRLAEANWASVSFATILLDEMAPYRREDGSNVRMSGPVTALNPRCALTLGMALHELATNAAKYGALSTKSGSVDVAWHTDRDERQFLIRWTESGGPPATPPKRSGFGRLLLERALASDLRGNVKLNFAKNGLECEISIPLEELAV